MKLKTIMFTGALLTFAVNSAIADRIGGGPRADFHNDELVVPCVKVTGLSDNTEGMYYDIILKREEGTFSYELFTAEPEDATFCASIANIAAFEDDDFDDSDDDSGSGSDDSFDTAGILVQCEIRPDRSRVSVKGDDLASGEYRAVVTSGGSSVESDSSQMPVDDEVEFDFDSDGGDIAEGATALASNFITGQPPSVMGEIFLLGQAEPVLSETVNCEIDG